MWPLVKTSINLILVVVSNYCFPRTHNTVEYSFFEKWPFIKKVHLGFSSGSDPSRGIFFFDSRKIESVLHTDSSQQSRQIRF